MFCQLLWIVIGKGIAEGSLCLMKKVLTVEKGYGSLDGRFKRHGSQPPENK
jgi:hypothetical protein